MHLALPLDWERVNFLWQRPTSQTAAFLCLSPTVGIITNIDPEHLEHWETEDNLINGFVDFANKVPFFWVCSALPRSSYRTADRPPVFIVASSPMVLVHRRPYERTTFVKMELKPHSNASQGSVSWRHPVTTPGQHNIQNALAAAAVCLELGVSFEQIQAALHGFTGVDRRFQRSSPRKN